MYATEEWKSGNAKSGFSDPPKMDNPKTEIGRSELLARKRWSKNGGRRRFLGKCCWGCEGRAQLTCTVDLLMYLTFSPSNVRTRAAVLPRPIPLASPGAA